jgi:transposase
MPAPLSLDLRTRIIEACQEQDETQAEMAARFRVHQKTVEKLWRVWRPTGSCAPRPHAGGTPARLAPLHRQLRAWAAERNDRTLAEWVALTRERAGVRTSVQALSRTLRQLGLPLEKRA